MTHNEADVKRNPHADFKETEASRPAWSNSPGFSFTQTADPSWKFGSGANHTHDGASKSSITIDPYEEGRPAVFNYKLLISAIIPRPIAFVSTLSAPDGEGKQSTNLAPMSYFQMVNHDPPMFVIGFASAAKQQDKIKKDTLRNLLATKECTINIISEGFVEAANSTSVNAPLGVSEWTVSGLTPKYDCETVKPARVGEAVFSIEAKLDEFREFDSKSKPGQASGTMVVLEGTKFWVREDAINEDKNMVDPTKLRAVSRLGGITYGRTIEGMEIPRPDFDKDLGGHEGFQKIESETRGANGKALGK